jgi:pSer/pThr/pTyr-binding forkhead associated (FHA) protein
MKVILEVTSGPDASRSFVIEAGQEVRVGRRAPAQILLANDRTVSRLHFALSFDGRNCTIRDLSSTHGTTVNGMPVTQAFLADGDLIVAGTTALRVFLGQNLSSGSISLGPKSLWPIELPPTGQTAAETQEHDIAEPTLQDRVTEVLRSQRKPLFAILDSARDPLVHLRIHDCPERKQSLYEGPEAVRLSFVAPYLIELPRKSPFLEQLAHQGWGNSWGVYLTSEKPFEEVRRHLRHFLTVEVPGGKKLLFRYYDPRVLRVYLPTCTPSESAEFFGLIRKYIMEGEKSTDVLEYRNNSAGVQARSKGLKGVAR